MVSRKSSIDEDYIRFSWQTMIMRKKKTRRKSINGFMVVFETASEGGYIARIPSLSGCTTQGETLKEAQKNAKEAIGGYLAVSDA